MFSIIIHHGVIFEGIIIVIIIFAAQVILSRRVNHFFLGFILPIIYAAFLLYLYFFEHRIEHLYQLGLVLLFGEAILMDIQYEQYQSAKNKRKKELDKIKAKNELKS